MVMNNKIYSLFSVYGIELEYMVVDKTSLEIKPITDEILTKLQGHITNEVELDEIAASNELVLHVIELKTNGPKPSLIKLDTSFHEGIIKINKLLEFYHACLMPAGAHPWLNPKNGIKLWSHGDRSIYETYHQIFNCEGHGWSNLQSTHINLPFANDAEFAKLHSAVRVILALIPALAASTPFLEGKYTGSLDTRLTYYALNQQKIPVISGDVIPEFVNSQQEYQDTILTPMYKAIAPWDKENILQYEWLNSRGAIARFERSAIEIRIMDIQECPLADISCIEAITGVLRYLIAQTNTYLEQPMSCTALRSIYDNCIQHGLKTEITDKTYLQQCALTSKGSVSARNLWQILLEQADSYIDKTHQVVLEKILSQGNLAERLVKTHHKMDGNKQSLPHIYRQLCECLQQ